LGYARQLKGDWSCAGPRGGKSPPQEEFQIETKSLIDLRDWTDQQLELLGKELEAWWLLTAYASD
jgi:hypothetical protein